MHFLVRWASSCLCTERPGSFVLWGRNIGSCLRFRHPCQACMAASAPASVPWLAVVTQVLKQCGAEGLPLKKVGSPLHMY